MPRGIKKQNVQEQPKKKTWSRKKKVTEPSPSTTSESTSTPDLGALHQELLHLREQEKALVQRKAEVEKQLRSALKSLGILDMMASRGEDGGEAPKRGRKPGRPAKADGGAAVKGKQRAAGPRYTDEERRAAVEFVDNEVNGGATITDALARYNKSSKPRGKTPMNYQSLLRWRQG